MAFTAQAAIALENARLFEQTQQRVRELALLYDSSLAITSTLDKSAVLRSVTERMARAVEASSTYIVQCDWENDTGTDYRRILQSTGQRSGTPLRHGRNAPPERLSTHAGCAAGSTPFDHAAEPGRCRSGCHRKPAALRRQEQPACTIDHSQSNAGLRRHLGQPHRTRLDRLGNPRLSDAGQSGSHCPGKRPVV